MKGDFTRNTFVPEKHFLRVLMQQGRVQLDSDWNEQAAILLHYLQTLATDIIGPYAGPSGADLGFAITAGETGDFNIGRGRYYVNGLLCENDRDDVTYLTQTDYPLSSTDAALNQGNYAVYLDVWERHISYLEDDDIREKALNGPDTATRSKVVWQVKVFPLTYQYAYCRQGSSLLNDDLLALSQVVMSARAKQGQSSTQPCLTEPEARYRGAENQLYRVEIHDGTIDEEGNVQTPTFKFSRENGSVVFAIKSFVYDAGADACTLTLEHLCCDDKLRLAVYDWVELVDDRSSLLNLPNPLLQVLAIDAIDRKVTLSGGNLVSIDLSKHPLLRRWDQKHQLGVIDLEFNLWIQLEAGIEVMFRIEDAGRIRTGDYWLIPARHATGDVEWPKLTDVHGNIQNDANNNPVPRELPPFGINHHYAPLAIISVTAGGSMSVNSDCRCSFSPLTDACQYNYFGRLGIGTDLLRIREEENR